MQKVQRVGLTRCWPTVGRIAQSRIHMASSYIYHYYHCITDNTVKRKTTANYAALTRCNAGKIYRYQYCVATYLTAQPTTSWPYHYSFASFSCPLIVTATVRLDAPNHLTMFTDRTVFIYSSLIVSFLLFSLLLETLSFSGQLLLPSAHTHLLLPTALVLPGFVTTPGGAEKY